MKRPLAALLLALPFVLPARAEEPLRLERFLPEKTALLVSVEDFPALKAKWDASPFTRAWNDPAVSRFLRPLREEMEIDRWHEYCVEAIGIGHEELLELPRGQVVGAVTDMEKLVETTSSRRDAEAARRRRRVEAMQADQPSPDEPEDPLREFRGMGPGGIVFVARIGEDRKALETMIAKGIEEARKEAAPGVEIRELTEEFQGETIHLRQVSHGGETLDAPVCWAFSADLWIFGPHRTDVQDVISRHKQGGTAPSLADAPRFQKARAATAGDDLLAYVDLAAFVEPIRTQMLQEMGEAPNPMGITADGLFKALGLDVLDSAYFSARLAETETSIRFQIEGRESKGLLKVLTAVTGGKAEKAPFLPSDALSLGAGRLDLAAGYDAVMEILNALSPQILQMAQMQLQMMSAQTGVDLRKDLLGNLGGDVWTADVLRPKDPSKAPTARDVDQVFVFSVKDAKAMETALQTLIQSMAPGQELFEKRDYLGTPIQTFKLPMMRDPEGNEKQLAYAFTDRFLVFSAGGSGGVEGVLAALAKPGASPWDREEVAQALSGIPADASSLSYTDLKAYGDLLLESIGEMADGEIVDLEAKLESGTIGRFVTASTGDSEVTPVRFSVRGRLLHAPAAEAP